MQKLTRLITLTCISSALMLNTVFAKSVSANHSPNHFIADLSEAMENASDDCESALPSSIQSLEYPQVIVNRVRSNCALMIRRGYEALKSANFSPQSYSLTTDRGLIRYVDGAIGVLGHDDAFIASARDTAEWIPRDVMEKLFYGVVGVYVYLDHDIDLSTGLPTR